MIIIVLETFNSIIDLPERPQKWDKKKSAAPFNSIIDLL